MDDKNKEDKEPEVFWYEFKIERMEPGSYGRSRYQLCIRLTPEDMYAIIKGITDYAIPENPAFVKEDTTKKK